MPVSDVDYPRVRLAGFDVLRAAGAFAVVWIHGCDTSSLARHLSSFAAFAVPCFVLMSFYLLQGRIMRDPAPATGPLAWQRMARLAPAYLGWTLVYLMARWLKHRTSGAGFEAEWRGWFLLGGASYQLYFVPLLVYCSVLLLPLMTWSARPGRRAMGIGMMTVLSLALLTAAIACGQQSWYQRLPFQLRQMGGMAWLAALGAVLALLFPSGIRLGCPRLSAIAPAVTGGVALFTCIATGVEGVAFTVTMTVPVFLSALLVSEWSPPRWLTRLSALSFGIYLAHGLWVEGLQMVAGRVGFALESFPATVGVIAVSFAGAWFTCEVLDRFGRVRWLVR